MQNGIVCFVNIRLYSSPLKLCFTSSIDNTTCCRSPLCMTLCHTSIFDPAIDDVKLDFKGDTQH